MALRIRSTAFEDGDVIPSRHTCDGEDESPPLTWAGVPVGTESLALILEDVDSVKGVWSHWVLYDVPPDVNSLRAGVPPSRSLSWGGIQGRSDFGDIGYGGPCPSDGKAHRYVVRLYALDEWLGLPPGATREEVLAATEGRVIEKAELMGRYKRLADR